MKLRSNAVLVLLVCTATAVAQEATATERKGDLPGEQAHEQLVRAVSLRTFSFFDAFKFVGEVGKGDVRRPLTVVKGNALEAVESIEKLLRDVRSAEDTEAALNALNELEKAVMAARRALWEAEKARSKND